MAENVANVYVGVIPTTEGIHGQLAAAFMPAAAKIGAQSGKAFDKSFASSMKGAGQATAVLGRELSRSMGAVVKAGHGSKLAAEFRAGFRAIQSDGAAVVGTAAKIGGAFATASKPLSNFRDGFKSSTAAASSFTGTMGSLGGVVAKATAPMTRVAGGLGQFRDGFRSSAAAASSWTGTMGTIGGKVGNAFRAVAAPVDGAIGKVAAFRARAGESFSGVSSAAHDLASNIGSAFSSFGGAVTGAAGTLVSFGTTAAAALGVAAGAAVAAAGTVGIKTAAQMETAQIAFETMLGSGQEAEAFLGQLSDFAAKTPFDLPGLQRSAQSLISIGIESDKVIPIMTTLGNVTSGMGTGAEGVQRATIAIQQMNAAGRITAEDLNQLRDAGIPVFDLLTAATGRTKEEIADMASKGKLGREELEQLMAALETGKGLERFNGMMEKQAASLSGLWSTLKDTFSVGMAEAIEPAIPLIKDGLGGAIEGVAAVMPVVSSALSNVVSFMADAGRIGGSVFAALRGDALTTAPAIELGFAPFEGVGGVITEILGSYRAFVAAVIRGGNDVTSSGMAGWFEQLGLTVRGWIDQLRPVVAEVLPSIRNGFENTFRIVGAVVGAVAPVIVSAVGIIVDVFARLWPPVMRFASAVTDVLGPVVSVAVFALGKVLQWLMNGVVGPVFRGIASVIGWALDGVVTPILNGLAWLLTTGLGGAFRWIGDTASSVWSGITSAVSAAAGWITGTALPAIRSAIDATGDGIRWFGDNVVRPVLNAVGAAFRWVYESIIQPVMRGVLAVVTMVAAAIVGIFQGIAWVLQKTLGPAFRWFNDVVVQPVWRAIQSGIERVANWWNAVAVPGIRRGIDAVAGAFRWVNDAMIQPIWRAIRAGIERVATWWLGTAVPIIRRGIDAMAGAFRWVNDVIIQPIWRGIRAGIERVQNWWTGTSVPAIRGGIDRVAGAFRWVRDVAVGAWDALRGGIQRGWDRIRDNVFTPLKRWLTESIPQWFRDTRDGIGRIWNKVVDKVREPVRRIVDVVINRGLIDNYNRLNDVWSGENIEPLSLKGWRKGGYTGDGNPNDVAGVVHKGEEVIPYERRREFEAKAPGLLGAMVKHGPDALPQFAPGSPTYGRSSFVGPQFSRNFHEREVYFGGDQASKSSWFLNDAVNAWNGHAGIKLRMGFNPSKPYVHATENGRVPGPIIPNWAGFYSGSQIQFNPVARRMSAAARRVIAIHEVGHALGLPHAHRGEGGNGAFSVMNYDNMYQAGGVTAADAAALRSIYPGKATRQPGSMPPLDGGGDEKPGWIQRIMDAVTKPFRDFKELFGKNKIGEMVVGIADKIIEGVLSRVGIGRDEAPMMGGDVEVFDNGGKLRKSAEPKLVQHRDTKPDYVFNHAQWQTLGTLAKTAAEQAATDGGRAGTTIEVENMFGSPEKIASELDRKRRRANTAAGIGRIRKVVI